MCCLCKDGTRNGLERSTMLKVEIKGGGFPNANNEYELKIKERKTTLLA